MLTLLTLIVAALSGVWNAYQKERESRALRMQAELQLYNLTQQQTQLSAQISKLETDRGKEEALREQYALGKKGEGLIIIVDSPTPAPVQASSTFMRLFQKAFSWW